MIPSHQYICLNSVESLDLSKYVNRDEKWNSADGKRKMIVKNSDFFIKENLCRFFLTRERRTQNRKKNKVTNREYMGVGDEYLTEVDLALTGVAPLLALVGINSRMKITDTGKFKKF